MTAIVHGGELSAIRQCHPDAPRPWIDLSTGVNPNPWPWQQRVSDEQLQAVCARLPDHGLASACLKSWVAYLGARDPQEWTLAAGSQAVINLLPQVFAGYGVCLAEPTYGEHVRVWRNAGRAVIRFKARSINSFEVPPRHVVIVTNPNNPDGFCYDVDDLSGLARRLAEQNSVLVVDEAFSDGATSLSLAALDLPPNILVMRSFGKFFGLAGLRIGCFRATGDLQLALQSLLGPWPVNAMALLVARCALDDGPWIAQTRQKLLRDSKALRELLQQSGLEIIGGTDLFCLVRSPLACEIADQLAQSGIYSRRFVEDDQVIRFGLPGNAAEFQRLSDALFNRHARVLSVTASR